MCFNKLLVVVIILIIIYLVPKFVKNYFRAVLLALKLKGPASFPLIGNCLLIKQNKELENIGNNIEQYGPIVRIWISILPTFIIYQPRHLKIVLGNSKASQKADYYKYLHNFLGNGLVTNDGEKWKQNRRLIQPMFNINILEIFIKYFKDISEKFVKNLGNNKDDIQISKLVNTFVLQVTLKTVLGIESNIKTPFRKCRPSLEYRLLRPWYLLEPFFKLTSVAEKEEEQKWCIYKFIEEILKSRISGKESTAFCFLDMFIELTNNNPVFTQQEMIKEICTLILAGQDTVATTISFALYHLAGHKQIQDKVYYELKSVLEKDTISLAEINALTFLDNCIKETLRLTPPIPMFGRKLIQDIQLDGYVIPANTNIFISPFCTQRLPHFYTNPQRFDPDRFNSFGKFQQHPFAYLPFSLGHRNCIGNKYAMLEIKIFLITILKTYQLELSKNHKNVELMYKLTLRAKGGIWIRFKKRS